MGRPVSEAAKERNRERARKWRAANRERFLATLASWREQHRDEARAATRAWQLAHPEKVIEHTRLRRERVQQATMVGVTPEQWAAILNQHGHRCVYCGQSDVKLGQDHVIPLARGGTHAPENVVPACFPCNNRKALNAAPQPPPAPWVRVRARRG